MRIYLNNIAKIKEANIEINGITVIAGENDTGKSTIGKALFSLFHSLLFIDNKIIKNKAAAIKNQVFRFLNSLENASPSILGNNIDDIFVNRNNLNHITDELLKFESIEDINAILKQYIRDDIYSEIDSGAINNFLDRIKRIKNVDWKESVNLILKNYFSYEFNYQINNIYTDDIGKISLTIKEKNIDLTIMNDNVFLDNDLSFNITEDIVYIDDPFILDDMYSMNRTYGFRRPSLNHRGHLLRQLCQQQENNIVEEVIKQESIQNIIKQLNNICPGALLLQPDSIEYVNNGKGINVKNLSSGLKTFAILKELIIKNIINTQGVIILDEPEIHLHPEWQLILAELIILLQVEFDLHILLTTHSPYFLNAIEVYAKKYQIIDRCKYYLSEYDASATGVLFSDVSKNIDKIYEKLAKPLQKLENLRY